MKRWGYLLLQGSEGSHSELTELVLLALQLCAHISARCSRTGHHRLCLLLLLHWPQLQLHVAVWEDIIIDC
jgi:hypothetical protein